MQNGTKRNMRTRQDYRAAGSNSDRFKRSPSRPSRSNGNGNAKSNYERYITLARAAALTGDRVETENYYQHAEHYFRLMKEQAS